MRRQVIGWLTLVGVVLGTATVSVQGPSPAQIQAALRAFLTQAHTWTALQTFTIPPAGLIICADTRVVFANGANTLGCDAGLTYNAGTDTLTTLALAMPTVVSGSDPAIMSVLPVAGGYDREASIWIGDLDGSIHEGKESSIVVGGYRTSLTNWGGGLLWASHDGSIGSVHLTPFKWDGVDKTQLGDVSIDTRHGGITVAESVFNQSVVSLFAGNSQVLTLSQVNNNLQYVLSGQPIITVDATGVTLGDATAVTLGDASALRTDTTTAHTALIQAYDVDGAAYKTFGTLTNGNTPSFALAAPSGGTLSGAFTTLSQGGFAVSLAGTFTTSGANALTLTTTGATNVTLPTSGTLLASGAAITGTVITGNYYVGNGSGLAVANVGANSCGTTAATIAGGASSFEITVGATAGTQCRVTLPTAPNRWNCTANNSTTANLARATPVDTTHVDFLGTFVAGDVVSGTCTAR